MMPVGTDYLRLPLFLIPRPGMAEKKEWEFLSSGVGFFVMRGLAAIIALVIAVLGGGPGRCPCQLQARLLPAAGKPVENRADARHEEGRGCQCKGHRAHSEVPADPAPCPDTPHSPRCPHCPAFDLAPPTAPGERAHGPIPADDLLVADTLVPAATIAPTGMRPQAIPLRYSCASPVERLRFCCAFRS